MLLERLYDEDLSQASYLVACQDSGEALVVDPRRDIADYLDLARHHGLRIVAVTETHVHADFLSGTRELAAATGATAYVSGEGGEDWQYDFPAERLHDGDTIELGAVTITARHTPGHTPEHLSFLITDTAFAPSPGYLLSGDFVFAGDLGRPDLLDEAAGMQDTRFEGARQLFASLRDVFLSLPDHVQVRPGHGAGSACGKALGAVPSTTVGYERSFAWWAPHLAADDEQGFIDELLDGQPDAHAYFGRMKRQNVLGPALLGERTLPRRVDASEIPTAMASGAIALVDTRPVAGVHEGMVPGALSIPAPGKAASPIGWAFDPESDDAEIIVLAIAFCRSGLRTSVAANSLRRAGHEATEVDGSYAGWSRWQQENDAPARARKKRPDSRRRARDRRISSLTGTLPVRGHEKREWRRRTPVSGVQALLHSQ